MSRLLLLLVVSLIPTAIGLSLVKLNERQKVGLPMFAYSKLNISDLNSIADKFKQFFTDVKESLDEYVESLTASGDGETIVEEEKQKELIKDAVKIEDKGNLVNDKEITNLDTKTIVIEDIKENGENNKIEIKVRTEVDTDKTQSTKPNDKKLAEPEKSVQKKDSTEKKVSIEKPQIVNSNDARGDKIDIKQEETKIVLEDKAQLKMNVVEDLNVNQKRTSPEKEKVEEIKKPEPNLIKTDSEVNKVESKPPQKTAPDTQKEIKGDSGNTEEL